MREILHNPFRHDLTFVVQSRRARPHDTKTIYGPKRGRTSSESESGTGGAAGLRIGLDELLESSLVPTPQGFLRAQEDVLG